MRCWIAILGGFCRMSGQHTRSESLFYYFRLERQGRLPQSLAADNTYGRYELLQWLDGPRYHALYPGERELDAVHVCTRKELLLRRSQFAESYPLTTRRRSVAADARRRSSACVGSIAVLRSTPVSCTAASLCGGKNSGVRAAATGVTQGGGAVRRTEESDRLHRLRQRRLQAVS